MQLSDQVVSQSLAKQLKEAGVTQSSLFYWVNFEKYPGKPDWAVENAGIDELKKENFEMVSAYTCSELGEMMPAVFENERKIKFDLNIWKDEIFWWVAYWWKEDSLRSSGLHIEKFCSKSLAEAMGEMLLYLIQSNLINPSTLSEGR